MQIKPRKKAWICLFFLGGIGTFQRLMADSNKKFQLPSQVVCKTSPAVSLSFPGRPAWRGMGPSAAEFVIAKYHSLDFCFAQLKADKS
jgi:hypothetical protein